MVDAVNITVSIFFLYAIVLLIVFLARVRTNSKIYRLIYLNIIVMYFLCLLSCSFFPSALSKHGVNFIPFVDISVMSSEGFSVDGVYNYISHAIINILKFAPLGVIVGVQCRLSTINRPVLIAFLISLSLSAAIETLQAVLPVARYADVDDLIFNVFGALIGCFCILRLCKSSRPFNHLLRKILV